jgi:glucose-6-phosphate 1-dehydrogenase
MASGQGPGLRAPVSSERLSPPAKTCDESRRGQYEEYARERGVKLGSQTETAFEIRTSLSSGKLKGVELVLESGKKMLSYEAFVRIVFKDISGIPKSMKFSLQPRQEIAIENRDGNSDIFEIPVTGDAYANVIRCALQGEEREFVGPEEIEALWAYADRVVDCWSRVPLEIYSDKKPFLLP